MNHPFSGKTAERSQLSPSAHQGPIPAETAFLSDVTETFQLTSKKTAASEMENWGGWWRLRFRENPKKARRILAEIADMIRTRKILRNPGAAAMDLWKRLP